MKPLTAIHSSKFPMLKTAVTRGAALFGMAGFVSTAMGDTVIDTILGWNGSASVSAFGLPNTATYGQTVTVPLSDPYLSSFTFEFNLPASNTFKGYVFAWDGTKAAGPSLYASPTMSTAGTGFQAVTFNTGLFSLTPGGVYVLFASTAAIPTSTGTGNWGQPSNTNPYAGGEFVYLNNGTDPTQWTTVSWTKNYLATGGDLAFRANFATVPEPASLGLLLFGAGALTLTRRRVS